MVFAIVVLINDAVTRTQDYKPWKTPNWDSSPRLQGKHFKWLLRQHLKSDLAVKFLSRLYTGTRVGAQWTQNGIHPNKFEMYTVKICLQ